MYKSDLHTHSNFSDGKSTPEEMILSAISLGIKSYGICDHATTPFDLSYCMTKVEEYKTQMHELKKKYEGMIDICLGIEEDGNATLQSHNEFDIIVGSLHYLNVDNKYIDVDGTVQQLIDCRRDYFGDNGVDMACAYYESLGNYLKKSECDIVGHFDLITKLNKDNILFDPLDKKYLDTAFSVAKAIIKTDKIFEMNTGAISRGYTKNPYPAKEILKYLCENGARITLSSDAHHKDYLLYKFDLCKKIAKECGFKTIWEMDKGKFIETAI